MSLPTDCPADCGFAPWRWTQRWLGDCVCSGRDAASFTLGAASVLAWAVAELPQIFANFRNGASEGVSFAFVATWLTGDALNLIGCAVSPSLPTQLYTAIVYTSTTVVLIAQHVAYGRRGAAKTKDERTSPLEARLLATHDAEEAETEARPIRRARNDTNAPPTESVGSRSLTSARTFVSGSWSGSGAPQSSARRSSSVGFRRPSGGETAQRRAGGRSLSEQARRRSVGGVSVEGTTSAALAAALGVAACVAVVIGVSVTVSPHAGTSTNLRGSVPTTEAMNALPNHRRLSLLSADRPRDGGEHTRGAAGDDGYAHKPLVPAPAWVGQALGWTMTCIYLGGRVPQILLNRKRESVEGLSVSMFFLAVIGNLTYFASILARSTRWNRVSPNLPWLVDAALCLAMDTVILWQYFRYSRRSNETRVFERGNTDGHERDERGDAREPPGARFVDDARERGNRGFARASRDSRDGDESGGLRVGYVALSGSEGSETWEGEYA